MIIPWVATGGFIFVTIIFFIVGSILNLKRYKLTSLVFSLLALTNYLVFYFEIGSFLPYNIYLPIVLAILLVSIVLLTRNVFKLRFQQNDEISENDFFVLKSKAVLKMENIIYIKADGHYVEFHLADSNSTEIDRRTLKEVLEFLPKEKFRQIQRGVVVNKDHIRKNGKDILLSDNSQFKISKYFQLAVQQ